uniref:Uncharacterized protein n=1 Tax=Strongyloides venezuelensis TaxID=75913 RepID=A0A0K0FZ35_STRVS
MKPSPNLFASFQTIKNTGGCCKYKCCITGVAALGLVALAYYYYTRSNSQSTNNEGMQKKRIEESSSASTTTQTASTADLPSKNN